MQTEFISILVGFLTAVATSIIGAWLSYRALRAEYLGKLNIEFINKQLAACEALWVVLEPASRSKGSKRVIIWKNDEPYVILSVANDLYNSLNAVFNSSSGLYFSRHLRGELFDLRNFIQNELTANVKAGQTEILVPRGKAEKFDSKVQQLRIAIRTEIRVEDLKVTTTGPINKL